MRPFHIQRQEIVMLKEVQFSVGRGAHSSGQVMYLVVERAIYFSAITQHPSSINAAEAIMVAIAEAEGIDWREYAFNDIQTHLGYQSKKPGEFECDGVEFYPETEVWPHVTGWTTVRCPDEVLHEFTDLIGLSPGAVITKAYEGKTWPEVVVAACQRHHDYYVRLHRRQNGELSPGDRAQYNLAMRREHDGFVQPLPEEASPT